MRWIILNVRHFEAPIALLLSGFSIYFSKYGKRLGDKEKYVKLAGMGLIIVASLIMGIAVSHLYM